MVVHVYQTINEGSHSNFAELRIGERDANIRQTNSVEYSEHLASLQSSRMKLCEMVIRHEGKESLQTLQSAQELNETFLLLM